MLQNSLPVIAWFSCGATSAVACKIALSLYSNVHIVYIKTGSEHHDNQRFLNECESWFGQHIIIISSEKYSSVEDVILHKRFINSPYGAICTSELKKKVRYKYEDTIKNWYGQVWGFDFCRREINRAIRFKQQNPKTKPLFPLIERGLTKADCLAILQRAGITLPTMYLLGYDNNNCVGCVKGGQGYWNAIRRDFPNVFNRMAQVERLVGASCLKTKFGTRLFLDELSPNNGIEVKPITPDCSITCAIEFEHLEDPQTQAVFNHQLPICNII